VTALWVALGALVGAPLRMLADRTAAARRGPGSVVGILVVNVAGSALLGFLVGLAEAPGWVLAVVGTGFCGTLTTFSTFGADAVRLRGQRRTGTAAAYLAGTLVLGIGAAAAAYGLAGLL
jgi:fluoride exporter